MPHRPPPLDLSTTAAENAVEGVPRERTVAFFVKTLRTSANNGIAAKIRHTVPAITRVRILMGTLSHIFGFPIASQTLVCKNNLLEPDQTLEECGVENGDVLILTSEVPFVRDVFSVQSVQQQLTRGRNFGAPRESGVLVWSASALEHYHVFWNDGWIQTRQPTNDHEHELKQQPSIYSYRRPHSSETPSVDATNNEPRQVVILSFYVTTPAGVASYYALPSTTPVRDLMRAVETFSLIAVSNQVLVCRGTLLDREHTLEDYKLANEDVIVVADQVPFVQGMSSVREVLQQLENGITFGGGSREVGVMVWSASHEEHYHVFWNHGWQTSSLPSRLPLQDRQAARVQASRRRV